MRCVVTGAAGFVGSHLCEALLARGSVVVGVDSFSPNYSPERKSFNQHIVLENPNYRFHAADLRRDDLGPIVEDADLVFHFAGIPGLERSWSNFEEYWTCNVLGTQRLLDAVRNLATPIKRLILASSASVYGKLALGNESSPTRPITPYGITKLAAEQIAHAYADTAQLPIVVLRYFSIYGPRQRPDMALSIFIDSLMRGESIPVYGDGQQLRGMTYIADAIDATLAAIAAPVGEVYNVGGASMTTMQVFQQLEELTGFTPRYHFVPPRLGDQSQTSADTTKIHNHLNWQPNTLLEVGLTRQWQWQSSVDFGSQPEKPPGTKRPNSRESGRRVCS